MGRISALICEFNPLHNGHKYILEKLGESSDASVCIMSGNFVQRGEAALLDKYRRAEAALTCGADLVLELPFPWCAAPAEFFALAGVSIAKNIGASKLVFGSECGDKVLLEKAASLTECEDFRALTEREYTENTGYAAARERAAKGLCPECEKIFSSSNDMLALEYIKQINKQGSFAEFEAAARLGNCLSASEIRKKVLSGEAAYVKNAVPEVTYGMLDDVLDTTRLFDIERVLFRLGKNDADSFDSECGILSRIKSCADKAQNGREMLSLAATKKYTDARIRRAALFSCFSVSRDELAAPPLFTVLLGANKNGRELLSECKGQLCVVTKPSALPSENEKCLAQYEKQRNADRLYALLRNEESAAYIKKSPVIL